jgi:hypothetical protein
MLQTRHAAASRLTTTEEHHRTPLVLDVTLSYEPDILCEPDRTNVLWLDHAHKPWNRQVAGPIEHGCYSFPSEPLAMEVRAKPPSNFRLPRIRRFRISLEIVDAYLAHEAAGASLLDEPPSVSECSPTSPVSEEPEPDLLSAQRTTTVEAVILGFAPHRETLGQVGRHVAPE